MHTLEQLRSGALVGTRRLDLSCGLTSLPPEVFGLADTLESMDPANLARIYSLLKPRMRDAYRELGHPEGDIDAAVERALVHLLET